MRAISSDEDVLEMRAVSRMISMLAMRAASRDDDVDKDVFGMRDVAVSREGNIANGRTACVAIRQCER
eukprot:1393300-Amorphochlora_amoeboformis.AAC.3